MNSFRVLITDNLAPAGLARLEQTDGLEPIVRSGLSPEELRQELQQADGIIVRSGTRLNAAALADTQRLKIIVRAGVGIDNIDLSAATREGVVVMNTPAGNTISTAEHTIAMMMSLSRNIAPAADSMRARRWDRKQFTGTQLAGKTLAIIGLGRIGVAVAIRAKGLEMDIVGYDPFMSDQRAEELGIRLVRSVDDVVRACDYLTVHTPLTDETRDLINADRIRSMKSGVRIINCARGGIINEQALTEAVESGHVAGAALDVFVNEPPDESSLTQLRNVLTTPHLGASTDEAQESVAVEAAELIAGFLLRGETRCAMNMIPVSAAEMAGLQHDMNLSYRLGLFLAQRVAGSALGSASVQFRGDIAGKKTGVLAAAFTTGLMERSFDDTVNIVNAETVARERGIDVQISTSTAPPSFASMVTATATTTDNDFQVSGTLFGQSFPRLVRLDGFELDAYLDGCLLIVRHNDVPGLIGHIGTKLGEHRINIGHMTLGRQPAAGASVAVLNLDTPPPDAAVSALSLHDDIRDVSVVQLPDSAAALPWMVSRPDPS